MKTAPLLQPWSDNALVGATASVIGAAADADFPLANLVDGDQMKASKLSATTGIWLFDFGSAVHLAVFALLHHNFDAGLDVEIRGYSAAPTLLADAPDLAVPITIPAQTGYYRRNVWADIDAVDDEAVYRYWGVAVTSANAHVLTVGEMFAAVAARAIPELRAQGFAIGTGIEVLEQRTYGGGSLRSQKGFPLMAFALTPEELEAPMADVDTIFQLSNGRAEPVLFVPAANEADVYLMIFDQDLLTRAISLGQTVYAAQIGLRELSRGLRWP